ncbi:MAG TPA: glycosyltransferase family 4 protein [Steroidobacteraceae bacterium]|jgi:glycosyltransferase involved in cell wall biosynthesis
MKRGQAAWPRLRFFNAYEPVTDFYRDLVPALRDAGLGVEVIVSRAAYRGGRSPLAGRLAAAGARLRRVPSLVGEPRSRAGKLLSQAGYWIGALALAATAGPDAFGVYLTQPPMFPLTGRLMHRLRGQRYACVVMDLYPQVLAAAGVLDARGRCHRWLLRRMQLTLQSAELVFAIGRCMRDRLLTLGVDAARIVLVHNWADERTIKPIERAANPLARRFGVDREFVVLYSGNMGRAHRFDTLLEAAWRLRDRRDIRFLLFGSGSRRAEIEAGVRERGLSAVVVADARPEVELAHSQSLGDLHFVCLRGAFTGLMVPSKAYAALAAGRPILYEGDASGEIARMISEQGIGRVVAEGDAAALASATAALADDRAGRAAMGARARELALGQYGRAAAVEAYVRALAGAARRAGGGSDAT